MLYQIEFIRTVEGRAEPSVVHRINGEFPTDQAAIDHGVVLFSTLQATTDAQGFRVIENGERLVAQRFKGSA
jgi:hypothetical protein